MLDLKKVRAKIIDEQSSELNYFDPTKDLANRLHPVYVNSVIESITDVTDDEKTIRLVPDFDAGTKEMPTFRAGQYISIFGEIDGSLITRPYTLASSPIDALHENYWEINVKKDENGFFTPWIWENWEVGTKVKSSSPFGFVYHDKIRDSKDYICICGGSGIALGRTMLRDAVQRDLPNKVTLIYGAKSVKDLAFKEEFDAYEKETNGRVKAVYVLSDPDPKDKWEGPTGFISKDIIKAAGGTADTTYFLCGPKVMYDFLDKEFEKMNVPAHCVRREASSVVDITKYPDYPKEKANDVYKLTVKCGLAKVDIEARADESLMVALERGGIAIPAHCRAGECGFCNSLLVSGDVYYRPDAEHRRLGDIRFHHIHPCVTYPLSDCEIEVQLVQE